MRVINPKFIEDGIKAFKLVYYAIFLLAVWYSLCHFITDTLGINFLDGANSLQMGSVVIFMLLILVYLFLLIKLCIKSLYEYVYIDPDKIITDYINTMVGRLREDLNRNQKVDQFYNFHEKTKSNYIKHILNGYKIVIEEELYNIYNCKKYVWIVVKNQDVYVKVSNVNKEPVMLDHDQNLKEYMENIKE